ALRTARERGDAYDLVFLDPPYRDAPGLGDALGEALAPLLAAAARIVAESDRRAPIELPFPLAHERRYGDTLIRIHTA
ncbi:MAG TPA: RsmD family RNA methyltransferase, partial [Solirubrobacteraceae bacterium]|nr:RsmD family RNA methyltransferase [Solirubrobacteraceae bacterium]